MQLVTDISEELKTCTAEDGYYFIGDCDASSEEVSKDIRGQFHQCLQKKYYIILYHFLKCMIIVKSFRQHVIKFFQTFQKNKICTLDINVGYDFPASFEEASEWLQKFEDLGISNQTNYNWENISEKVINWDSVKQLQFNVERGSLGKIYQIVGVCGSKKLQTPEVVYSII